MLSPLHRRRDVDVGINIGYVHNGILTQSLMMLTIVSTFAARYGPFEETPVAIWPHRQRSNTHVMAVCDVRVMYFIRALR